MNGSLVTGAVKQASLALLVVALVVGCTSANNASSESVVISTEAPGTTVPVARELASAFCALSGNVEPDSTKAQAFLVSGSAEVDEMTTVAADLCPDFARAALYAHQAAAYAVAVAEAQKQEYARQALAYADAVAKQQDYDRQVQAYVAAVATAAAEAKAKAQVEAQAQAQASDQATQPAISGNGATALCNDGTLSYSQHRSGTCSHHGGVAIWY